MNESIIKTDTRRNRIKLLNFDGSSEKLDPARLQLHFISKQEQPRLRALSQKVPTR